MKQKEEFVGFLRHEYCPMIRPKTEALLLEVLRDLQPKNILEIGTFLGYSAALMLENCPNAHVTTVEKDQQNFADAKENLKGFDGRVDVLCCDAVDFLKAACHVEQVPARFWAPTPDSPSVADAKHHDTLAPLTAQNDKVRWHAVETSQYDFIFLDGPKGQYVKYLPFLKSLLREGGVLMCDDILFYGLVQADGKIAHKHRSIVNNLRKFLDTLQADTDFETKIYDFEDGVSVSKKLIK